MRVAKQRSILVLAAVMAVGHLFAGQPTLQEVWARHDQIVMSGPGRTLKLEASHSHTFKGKNGRIVHGWDVGGANLPAVLWWGGGPGLPADPAWDVNCFEEASAYRHLEIDSPGTGLSSWVPGWKPEDTVDDAAEFLRLRGIGTPVLVTGYSWGSTMALLFAQRHPELVRGVVIGGVWANTRQEVAAFLGEQGNRRWMPGLQDSFRKVVGRRISASTLHRAIRDGRGGIAFCKAFGEAEIAQASEGKILRKPNIYEPPLEYSQPVDMSREQDEDVRSAFIESEMMMRGERGEWALTIRFNNRLSLVPLIVLQGRYDQVCSREIAMKVFKAWPGNSKLLVPMNGGHWGYGGPDKQTFAAAGLVMTEAQEAAVKRAMALHFGSHRALIGAAIDCLAGRAQSGR